MPWDSPGQRGKSWVKKTKTPTTMCVWIIYIYVYLSICLSVCLSTYLSICVIKKRKSTISISINQISILSPLYPHFIPTLSDPHSALAGCLKPLFIVGCPHCSPLDCFVLYRPMLWFLMMESHYIWINLFYPKCVNWIIPLSVYIHTVDCPHHTHLYWVP